MPQPLPYDGADLARRHQLGRVHCGEGPEWDADQPERYRYNTLGYRGAEFLVDADFTVFVFGESDAFGLGLDFEDAWPSLVVQQEAAARGIPMDRVCYMNFADTGASNASVARAVVTQCGRLRPDLVLVNFAPPDRAESYVGDRTFQIGPWALETSVQDGVHRLAENDGCRTRYLDLLRRGLAYIEFASEAHGRLDALRNILFVQSFLAARGIQGYATARQGYELVGPAALADDVLRPLAEQVDEGFLLPFGLDQFGGDGEHSVDGHHFQAPVHVRFAAAVGDVLRGGAAPSVAGGAGRQAEVGREVRAFYDAMPFNFHGSAADAEAAVRAGQIRATYPDLHEVLRSGDVQRVLEVGCGTGWLANEMALQYGVEVVALDFSSSALCRARELATRLAVTDRVRFVEGDLFQVAELPVPDLVVSLGVLHHTIDTASALRRCVELAGAVPRLYIGLYHAPARELMHARFGAVLRDEGEAAAFAAFREMLDAQGDEAFARSWFRDQLQHPHESAHTLREARAWLREHGLEVRSTSINRFDPIGDIEAVLALESGYRETCAKALDAGRFFPGFFTFYATAAT